MTDDMETLPAERIQSGPPMSAATAGAVVKEASGIATQLAEIVSKRGLAKSIQGRAYVQCEGWTTLAAMLGATPHCVEIRENEGVFQAHVEIRRMSDGAVLSQAWAECGADDEVWGKRQRYARISMAQTRATSKACRLAYSWIMVLAGYEATPAEEMDGVDDRREGPSAPRAAPSGGSGGGGGKRGGSTEAQQKCIYAKAKGLYTTDESFEGFQQWLRDEFGTDHTKELTKQQAGEVIEELVRQEKS